MTEKATPEQFRALLETRHSCRGFLPDQLPDEVISEIVRSAQKVPSWCNAQPWQLVITRGKETDLFRDMLANEIATGTQNFDLAPPARYEGVYKERRSTTGWQLYDAVGVTKGDRQGSAVQMAENFRFFGAPHVAIISTPQELGSYGVLDCGAFVTGFTLAAEAAGVASIAQAALAGFSEQVRAYFGIAEGRQVVCGISFGLRDDYHPANGFRTSRADPDDVIDWR